MLNGLSTGLRVILGIQFVLALLFLLPGALADLLGLPAHFSRLPFEAGRRASVVAAAAIEVVADADEPAALVGRDAERTPGPGGELDRHVRVGDPFIGPVILGALAWLGLYLRDPRLRELIPFRR